MEDKSNWYCQEHPGPTGGCNACFEHLTSALRYNKAALAAAERERDIAIENSAILADDKEFLLTKVKAVERERHDLAKQLKNCGKENCMGHRLEGWANWVREERFLEVKGRAEAAEREVERLSTPNIRIIYIPPSDPKKRRHTAWLRWATAGECPESFGEIRAISKFDPAALPSSEAGRKP